MTAPDQPFPLFQPFCPVDPSHRITGRGPSTGATEWRCEDCGRAVGVGELIGGCLGGLGGLFGGSGQGATASLSDQGSMKLFKETK